MNWWRWIEFFEDDNSRLSITRLSTFLAFFPASWIVIKLCTEMALGIYISAFVVQYGGGKALDVWMKKAKGAKATK